MLKNHLSTLKRTAYLLALTPLLLTSCKKNLHPDPIELFDGKTLNGWTPKIRNHPVGQNFGNTFRVEDGLLKVRYDEYPNFNFQYGHLFYNKEFSAYLLEVTYRFVGEQAPGGEDWAWRNSGAMLHGQSAETMGVDQDFPISIEGQLLGGDGKNARSTSNLCTPGTNVVYKKELFTPHCLSSTSKTYAGDQWVTAKFLVLRDSVVKHILEDEVVLEYEKPQIGGGMVTGYDPKVKKDGQLLSKGTISLQSESHPIDFKSVKLYNLEPYMNDTTSLNKVIHYLLPKLKEK